SVPNISKTLQPPPLRGNSPSRRRFDIVAPQRSGAKWVGAGACCGPYPCPPQIVQPNRQSPASLQEHMITGPLKQQIDTLWNQFYNRGFNNSLRVIEQITYLLFARRLDDMQTSAESMDNLLGAPAPGQKRTFGKDQQ